MHTAPLSFPKQGESYSLQTPSLAEITLNLYRSAAERVSDSHKQQRLRAWCRAEGSSDWRCCVFLELNRLRAAN